MRPSPFISPVFPPLCCPLPLSVPSLHRPRPPQNPFRSFPPRTLGLHSRLLPVPSPLLSHRHSLASPPPAAVSLFLERARPARPCPLGEKKKKSTTTIHPLDHHGSLLITFLHGCPLMRAVEPTAECRGGVGEGEKAQRARVCCCCCCCCCRWSVGRSIRGAKPAATAGDRRPLADRGGGGKGSRLDARSRATRAGARPSREGRRCAPSSLGSPALPALAGLPEEGGRGKARLTPLRWVRSRGALGGGRRARAAVTPTLLAGCALVGWRAGRSAFRGTRARGGCCCCSLPPSLPPSPLPLPPSPPSTRRPAQRTTEQQQQRPSP